MWTVKCYGSNNRLIIDLAKTILQRRLFADSAAGVGPLDVLKARVEKKELLPDQHQLRVAESLQAVYERIQLYEPAAAASKSWMNIFGKTEKRVKPPKGEACH